MLLTKHVVTLINGAIGPTLFSLTMLEVIFPHTFVASSIDMNIGTESVSFVTDPVSFIDVSVDMDELSLAVSTVVFPLTLVGGAIDPGLLPIAVSEPSDPLTNIGSFRSENIKRALLSLSMGVILSVADGLSGLFNGEVPAVGSLGLPEFGHLLSHLVSSVEGLEPNNLFCVAAEFIERI